MLRSFSALLTTLVMHHQNDNKIGQWQAGSLIIQPPPFFGDFLSWRGRRVAWTKLYQIRMLEEFVLAFRQAPPLRNESDSKATMVKNRGENFAHFKLRKLQAGWARCTIQYLKFSLGSNLYYTLSGVECERSAAGDIRRLVKRIKIYKKLIRR